MIPDPGTVPEGFIILDKPSGITSHHCLAAVARQLGRKVKAGHAGTLDSFASGVLIALFGRYTRLSDYFMATDKRYLATLRFGAETSTLDPEGETIRELPPPEPSRVEAVLPDFIGEIDQIPPVYSAVHVQGQRAYRMAMRGEVPEMPVRKVRIDSISVRDWLETGVILDVRCSKGTYIRSLARDIAGAAGSCGHLAALRRLSSGPFTAETACAPQHVTAEKLRKMSSELAIQLGLGVVTLDDGAARAFRNGHPLYKITEFRSPSMETELAVFDTAGNFLGIARYSGQRWSYAFVLAEQP